MKLLVRVDVGRQMGMGHLMRCLALAQAWRTQGGSVCFALASEVADLAPRLQAEGIELLRLPIAEAGSTADAHATSALAHSQQAAWVVVDGYHFGADYQQVLQGAGMRLLVIDDYGHAERYMADLVLNQNLAAEAALYDGRCAPTTRCLLGSDYTLLRREFGAWRGFERTHPAHATRCLVTLGGSDPHQQTAKVLAALALLPADPPLDVDVVVGAGNPQRAALQALAAQTTHQMQVLYNVTDMAPLMARAEMALSAAGSSCWELALLGVPMLLLVTAENQRPLAEALAAQGAALNLGWYADVAPAHIAAQLAALQSDQAWRVQLGGRAQALMDGWGAQRVVAALMRRVPFEVQLALRPALPQDMRLLWQWANEAAVRQNSFNPDPIPLADHQRWYAAKLATPETRLWFLERDGRPVAHIRYERLSAEVAEISYMVAQEARRQGLGTALLRHTAARACRALGVPRVRGGVLLDNVASIRAFEKAGFVRHPDTQMINGRTALFFEWGVDER